MEKPFAFHVMKNRNIFLPAKTKLHEGWKSLLALHTTASGVVLRRRKNLVDEHSALQLATKMRSFQRTTYKIRQEDTIIN